MGLKDRLNKKASTSEGIGLKDGEIVQCMLLQKIVPAKQRKEWNEIEQLKKDNAETLGDLYEPIPPSYKECGVSWKIAVIKRDIKINEFGEVSGGELVFKPKDGKVLLPKYSVTSYFQHLPPEMILNIKSKNGFKYGNMFRMAGSDQLDTKGDPVISTLYPSVQPLKDNNPDVPYQERLSADEIPDDKKEQYQRLLDAEDERKTEWRSLMNEYNELSEIEAEEYLDDCISRRMMLCYISELAEEGSTPEIIYHRPQVGMKFTCKITRNGKYFNINILINEKIAGAYVLSNYSTNQVELPKDKDRKVAEAILEAYEEFFQKKNSTEKVEEEPEEDKF